MLILIVDIFVPVGRFLGRLLNDHPRTIWAYSVNVAGSLVGIWLFVVLSVFYLPPVAWFAIVCALVVLFVVRERDDRRLNLALLAAVVTLAWFAGRVPGALDVGVVAVPEARAPGARRTRTERSATTSSP